MKKIFKSLSLATSIAVSAGLAGQAAAVVSASSNGQGDLQLVPVAAVAGGWQTEISLINSSSTMSTVSKVVIRSSKNSRECLDFMVYLSPGDRFVGTYMEASSLPSGVSVPTQLDGTPATYVFYSADDSVRSATSGNPASETDPAVYPLQDVDNTCAVSYVEIVESAAFSLGNAPVDKANIIAAHDANQEGASNALNPPVNTISGDYTLMNTINGVKMSDTMDVFTGYANQVYLNVGANTLLGVNTADGMGPLEAAMAKQNIKAPYEHDNSGEATVVSVTFPTKMEYDTQGQRSTYAPLIGSGRWPTIGTTVRDMHERIMANSCTDPNNGGIVSPPPPTCNPSTNGEALLEEANLINVESKILELAQLNNSGGGTVIPPEDLAANFTKGWININFEEGTTDTFTGAPALTRVMQFSVNGSGALNGTLKQISRD